jgi:uncharacterized protein (TIGR02270 family)
MKSLDCSRARVMREVVAEHFEHIRSLWRERHRALQSPDYTLGELSQLEERIDAHLDGLRIAGERAISMLKATLEGDDMSAISAAAFVLLMLERDDAAAKVVEAILQSQGPQIDGLRQALCLGDIARIVPRLRELFASDSSLPAAVAAEALAFHGQLETGPMRLAALLGDENPVVRCIAWRVVAIVDSADRRR